MVCVFLPHHNSRTTYIRSVLLMFPILRPQQRDEVMNMLKDYYQELQGTSGISYVADVWLPEVYTCRICAITSRTITKITEGNTRVLKFVNLDL